MGRVSRAAETFLQSRCKHTPNPPPPRFMYLLNSGAETLFVVPGVPKQLVLPSNTSDSKTTKREMDGKMQPPSGVGGMGGRKRQNLTLDLNSASPKKNKVQNLLTSPDVQMLKLTSPPSLSPPSHQTIRSPDQTPGPPAPTTLTPISCQRALWLSKSRTSRMTDQWTTRMTRSLCCLQQGRGSVLLTWRVRRKLN